MTAKEAAKRLGTSPATVHQLCRGKLLGHARIGVRRGRYNISEAQIVAYLASRTVEPPRPKRIEVRTPAPGGGSNLDIDKAVEAHLKKRQNARPR